MNYLLVEQAIARRGISKGIAIYDMSQNPPRLVSTHEVVPGSTRKGRRPRLRRTDSVAKRETRRQRRARERSASENTTMALNANVARANLAPDVGRVARRLARLG